LQSHPEKEQKMGFHICEYITRDRAKEMGLRNWEAAHSSGDVVMSFSSGRAWIMPDMAPLYIELGWVPPQAFIDDVMHAELMSADRNQTRSTVPPTPVGYLTPKKHPLPLTMCEDIPEFFLIRLEFLMEKAATLGNGFNGYTGRRQTKDIGSGPRQ
jgi:hypothetical protein